MIYKVYFIVFLSFFNTKPTNENNPITTNTKGALHLAENKTISKTEEVFSMIE